MRPEAARYTARVLAVVPVVEVGVAYGLQTAGAPGLLAIGGGVTAALTLGLPMAADEDERQDLEGGER